MRSVVSSSITSFPWLISFFAALLWGSLIQTYRKIDVTREPISHILELREMLLLFQTGFTLSMLVSSVLSWRVSQAWNPCQIQLSPSIWSLWSSQTSVRLLWYPCWCRWWWLSQRFLTVPRRRTYCFNNGIFLTSFTLTFNAIQYLGCLRA